MVRKSVALRKAVEEWKAFDEKLMSIQWEKKNTRYPRILNFSREKNEVKTRELESREEFKDYDFHVPRMESFRERRNVTASCI